MLGCRRLLPDESIKAVEMHTEYKQTIRSLLA